MFRVIGGGRKKLCPYCFEYFRLRERDLREGIRTKASCSECQMELPYSKGTGRNYIFSVIGAKEAGKSNYIAALVSRIWDIGGALDILLHEADDYTLNRYRRDFYQPLFEHRRVVNLTQSATAEGSEVSRPLIFQLEVTRPFYRKTSATLAFFDSAGEDFHDSRTMAKVHRHIRRSDGIILLFDPLQLPEVRKVITDDLPPENDQATQVLTNTTRLIRGKSMKTSKISIPIAVAFSKLDTLEKTLPRADATPHCAQYGSSCRRVRLQ